jgi:hypothetical protein
VGRDGGQRGGVSQGVLVVGDCAHAGWPGASWHIGMSDKATRLLQSAALVCHELANVTA